MKALLCRAATAAALVTGLLPLRAADPSLAEARALYEARKFAETEQFCRAALASLAHAGQADSLPAIPFLDLLARSITLAGRPPDALPVAVQAAAIADRHLPPDDLRRLPSLQLLVFAYNWNQQHGPARRVLDTILSIQSAAHGPEHTDSLDALEQIAANQFSLGAFADAAASFQRLLALREKTAGPLDHLTAQALSGLGLSQWRLGRLTAARKNLERALRIQLQRNGERGVYTAATLHNLGLVVGAMGDLKRQLDLERRALRIRESDWGPEHPTTANGLVTLGMLQARAGDAAGARDSFLKSEQIRRRTLGPRHRYTAQSLYSLASTYLTEDPQRAVHLALEADSVLNDWLRANLRSLSEREAVSLARVERDGLYVALEAIRRPNAVPEALRRRVWDAVLRNRGLVLDEAAWRRKLPGGHRINTLRASFSRLLLAGPAGASLSTHAARLDALRREVELAERELAEQNAPFRETLERERADFSQLASALPPRAALVGYLRFQRGLFNPRDHYGAFVLQPGAAATRFLDLGPAAAIDPLIAAWRLQFVMEARNPARAPAFMESAARSAGDAVRARLWDPLAPFLARAATVFLVPDGPLHLVHFAALPSADGRYLLESGPLLHYLNSELDLLSPPSDSDSSARTLLAVGDPDFDLSNRPVATSSRRALRGADAACFDPDSLRFERLPFSLTEARQVLDAWTRAGGRGALISGAAASTDAFRRQGPGSHVLHLATHGFFFPSRCDSPASSLPIAGLALAGANRDPSGLLTAEQIAALPLDGAEWAVLSGCDTGLGAVEAGEGVFGLRRAFQLAGARTVVMSLWPVPDDAAQRWMAELYRNRLQHRMPTARAVRAASLAVLGRRRQAGLSTHPLYWAPFVAAGDWR